MPTLQVIIGSTRPGRLGAPIGEWLAKRALDTPFDVELVDLAEVNLPLLNEPRHPRLGEYVHEHTRDWSATIARADAFVFVIPEYNYGYNAAIKNAIDYLHNEWKHKPVGLLSYGGVSAGTRAAQMLKQVITTLSMMPVPEAVSIPFVSQFFNEESCFVPSPLIETAAEDMLASLVRWTQAMATFHKN